MVSMLLTPFAVNGSYIITLCSVFVKAVANGPLGQVLARPLVLKVKIKNPFYKKQVINNSTRVIFGLV